MLGLPAADNIRWRLFTGLPVASASRSNPTVALETPGVWCLAAGWVHLP